MKHIILIVFTFISVSLSAQIDEAYSKDVKQCVKSNGTFEYYENVIDQMFSVLEDQFEPQNVPEKVWLELKAKKSEFMSDLSTMIVSAYNAHFTHEDVKIMNALYATDAGKNMFKAPEKVTDEDREILNEFYKSDTGQKIIGSQDSMNGAMSQISELWSSNMYKDVINTLSEKGFNL